MIVNAEVGIRIAVARKARGMTQRDVGRLLSRPRSNVAVSYIEKGKTKIDIELLSEIAELLDVPFLWFVQPLGIETRPVFVAPPPPETSEARG